MGRGNINVQRNSLRLEYATIIRGNAVRERESFKEGTEARESNTTIMTLTPDVSRRPWEILHHAAQGLPLLANGLMGDRLNVEWNSLRREYATVIKGNAVRARQSLTKGTEAWESNTTIKTTTRDVSRTSGANLHQAAQGLPPLANDLVGERLNELFNSQGCNQCGIITHTHKRRRGNSNVEQNSVKREYATPIRRNAVSERQSFTKGTVAQGSNNTITTPTLYVFRISGANLHSTAQPLPPLEKWFGGWRA